MEFRIKKSVYKEVKGISLVPFKMSYIDASTEFVMEQD